tara:strand:+ start:183 stop:572 length:390 start_codon:yes stop_codon:yes gene_type:complete
MTQDLIHSTYCDELEKEKNEFFKRIKNGNPDMIAENEDLILVKVRFGDVELYVEKDDSEKELPKFMIQKNIRDDKELFIDSIKGTCMNYVLCKDCVLDFEFEFEFEYDEVIVIKITKIINNPNSEAHEH